MRFWLGTHMTNWPETVPVRFMLSRVRLAPRKRLPRALEPWVLDSGGFSELSLRGSWDAVPAPTYVREVRRFADEMGNLEWAAPQDWMAEPFILAKTGLTVADHQARTVGNFLTLRQSLGALVIPVLQGYSRDDYLRCADLYGRSGVDLERERIVGLGSVCRRQATDEIGHIVASFPTFSLHGFGCKMGALERFGHMLASADSMAWSYQGRRQKPCPRRDVVSCGNCLHFALDWRARLDDVQPRPFQPELAVSA